MQIFQISQAQAINAYPTALMIPGLWVLGFTPFWTIKNLMEYQCRKVCIVLGPHPSPESIGGAILSEAVPERSANENSCHCCLQTVLSVQKARSGKSQAVCVRVSGPKPFIQIKRTGQKYFKRERIVSLPKFP